MRQVWGRLNRLRFKIQLYVNDYRVPDWPATPALHTSFHRQSDGRTYLHFHKSREKHGVIRRIGLTLILRYVRGWSIVWLASTTLTKSQGYNATRTFISGHFRLSVPSRPFIDILHLVTRMFGAALRFKLCRFPSKWRFTKLRLRRLSHSDGRNLDLCLRVIVFCFCPIFMLFASYSLAPSLGR